MIRTSLTAASVALLTACGGQAAAPDAAADGSITTSDGLKLIPVAEGLAYHEASGILFAHEHGPKGGDELNIIEPGNNYGWPTITYGINYDGSIITDETEAPGLEQPAVKWVPSIAPSGMAVVMTVGFEDWSGDLLIGAMDGPQGQKLVRVDIAADGGVGETQDLLSDMQIGYRDVISTPDAIYIATNGLDGAVYRVEKAE